jgi:hypothetical protein
VPQCTPSPAIADFEAASVSGFQHAFGSVNVSGCWFHYVQAIIKRVNKIGLRDAYRQNNNEKDTVHCLLGLPMLPASDITVAVDDITQAVNVRSLFASKLVSFITFVRRQ